MKDIPLPVEALNDVLPGSPWQPEPAARYNALNALLRQEGAAGFADSSPSRGSEVLLPVRNITAAVLPGGKAVEICPDPQPGSGIDFLRPMLFGRAVAEENRFWGIATEDIPPGRGGLVQVGGAAVVRGVQGTPDRYVVPKADGNFHFSSGGRAEVLYYVPGGADAAVIYLGGSGNPGCTGMFQVIENGDGTVSVDGGMAAVQYGTSYVAVSGTILQRPPSNSNYQYVLLNAELQNGAWTISFSIDTSGRYIPGQKIYWVLARLSRSNEPMIQLWQGGAIDFATKYYLT